LLAHSNGAEVTTDFNRNPLARTRVCYSHEYDGGYAPCVAPECRKAMKKRHVVKHGIKGLLDIDPQQKKQQLPPRPVPWRSQHLGFSTRAQEVAAFRRKNG
jgi:hypothetical protein